MYRVTFHEDINDKKSTIIHYPNIEQIKLTSGNVGQGVNVVNSFTFTLNMKNPAYSKIKPRKSLLNVYNTKTGKDEFNGYVLRLNSTMAANGMYNKSFTAVDGLNYLKETSQPFAEIHNKTPKEFLQIVIDNHNASTDNHKKFILGTVNVTNSTDNVYRFLSQDMNTFDTIFDKLVDRLGGEIRTRFVDGQWYLDWMTVIGEEKTTEIRVGKNLKSQDRDEDTETVATRWYIYGATIEAEEGAEVSDVSRPRISISSVNGGKAYIDDVKGIEQFGIIAGIKVFDDVNQPNILLTKGKEFVNTYKQVTISNQVSAYDLSLIGKDIDAYEVYNSYPLNNPGITEKETVRIVEKRIDINNPQLNTLTIGDKYQTASQYQADMKKSQKSYEGLRTMVANQTQTIGNLKTQIANVGEIVDVINLEIGEADIPGLKQAVNNLNDVVDALNDSIGSIPVYDVATVYKDGLMSSQNVIKLNSLQHYDKATGLTDGLMAKEDKQKLNRILANQSIDLDQFMADFLALKELVEGI
ncbi:phage tail spike protein [Carnobacterium antarcticum]|uniref:Phage tail spike protein n=1 Tax=Carnobacterium antarcticum TaxID=2126436 RepID=A0ABW4NMK0_9LACT|nr:phage tail spike protein [Carnobacterium sp. CP1]ALV21067.1 Tail length tape measure protein [Carnobacterium sp. CP1]